jgi:uncharacterized phage protein (TIGR01671 family)
MNQIKFRALNEETKVFVYGDLIKSQMFGSEGEKPSSSFINETPLDVEDISTCLGGGKYSFRTTFVKVIDETAGQFTGLQDKNGVDIYEGDIIIEGGITAQIIFDQPRAYYCYETLTGRAGLYSFYGKVIGNIHQNPELIK